MARFRDFRSEDEADAGIDMSPMIDCVFILLIFFIVTTTFVEEAGVEVDKPQAAASVSLEKNSVIFALTAEGEVFFDSKPVGIAAVRGIVARKMLKEQQPVIVQVDQNASAGMLTRVIDQCKLGNAPKVSIATRKADS
ncbi:MAG: biopolymer transporter ExbD [Planctomycetes bacterium]|nr:biopolymer transporter ExbD [Planctomycetota bacterium]